MAVTGNFDPTTGTVSLEGDALDNTITASRDAAGAILANGGAVAIQGGTPTVINTSLLVISGQDGADTITLEELNGALPDVSVLGGAGNDLVVGGSGNDLIFGEDGDDTLLGKKGDDFLSGGAGNDTLTGGDNDDVLFGGAGNDRFLWDPGDDSDTIEGDADFDTVQVNGGNGAETFSVTPNGARFDIVRTIPVSFRLDAGTIEAIVINVNGGDDIVTADAALGTNVNLTLNGGLGNDIITGGGGDDTINGGDGDDTLAGGAGNDGFVWNPGDDNDEIDGGSGFDRLTFRGANINENIDISNDDGFGRFFRDVANVTMLTGAVERIEYQALGGVDVIAINDLTGTGITQVAIDLAGPANAGAGAAAIDRVILNGSNAASNLSLTSVGSTVVVNGLSAQVTVDHADAIDTLTINAFGGDDTIDASGVAAGATPLVIDAGAGNDTVTGSAGFDTLLGGDGNDTVSGGRGDDVAFLGVGSDTFVWKVGDGSDIVEGQGDFDHLNVSGSTANDRFTLTANGSRVLVAHDQSNATLDVNDVERFELLTSAGQDTVILNDLSGTDVTQVVMDLGADGARDEVDVAATAGNDSIRLISVLGNVHVIGLAAEILMSRTDAIDQVVVSGGAGNDTIDASALPAGLMSVVMQGGAGADHLVGSAGIDTVTYAASAAGVNVNLSQQDGVGGDAEGDTLSGIENLIGSAHDDFLVGSAGANVMTGGAGNDFIKGAGGNDVLIGGAGNDEIIGNDGDDTAVFDVDFNSVKVSFDDDAIVIESAEGRDVLRGIEHFRFTDGTIDLNDGNPLVDDLFYYAANRDVWDAGIDAETHYNFFGWREGRDPSADFSTGGYLSANSDVKAAGINPLTHFDQFGWRKGRDPSADFDVRLYLERNPDVAASGVNPLAHYEQFGRGEGREAFAAIGDGIRNGFDFEYYLLQNPDVGAAGVDPLLHFQTFGRNEGRDPNAWFDTKGYLAAYGDVAAAGVNPLDHYLAFGAHEGRDPSAAFDTSDYLAANPDVAAAGVNPLQHFLQFGIHEGRLPFSDGVFS